MNTKGFLSLWGPVVLWCLLIFTFSSLPTLPKTEIIWWDFILKKTAHMVEFGILYFLVFRAFSGGVRNQKLSLKYFLIPFIFVFLYAASDEYHQSFVPGRTSKIRDVGFDLAGIIIAYGLISKKLKFK